MFVIAVIGPRASGKTLVANLIMKELQSPDYKLSPKILSESPSSRTFMAKYQSLYRSRSVIVLDNVMTFADMSVVTDLFDMAQLNNEKLITVRVNPLRNGEALTNENIDLNEPVMGTDVTINNEFNGELSDKVRYVQAQILNSLITPFIAAQV